MLWDIITCGVEIQWKSSSFYKNSAVPSLFMLVLFVQIDVLTASWFFLLL